MTWLAVKTFFKKAWAWVVKYWQYFALACYTVIVYTLLRKNKNADNIKQAFKASKKAHKEEVEAINNAHKEELAKRDKIIEDYNKTIMKLDEKIVEETHNDPEGRTARIANEFGFELVTIDDTTG